MYLKIYQLFRFKWIWKLLSNFPQGMSLTFVYFILLDRKLFHARGKQLDGKYFKERIVKIFSANQGVGAPKLYT
jgi:hypothetical protein